MKRLNQIVDGVFNQKTGNFAEAYGFPEKLFQIFGIYSEKRERDELTPLIFVYKWFNLLIPLLYVSFAINSMESIGEVHKIFESMCGISASINCSVKVLTYYNNGNEIMKLKRMAIAELNGYIRGGPSMENRHAVKYLKIMNFTSKYITIIYSVCGIIFISLPFAFYIFDLPREDWMLPLTLRIFFTNNKAHPGYALNFLVSAYAVNNLCLMLAATDLTFMHLCFYVFIQLTICKTHCHDIGETSSGTSPRQQYDHLRKCIILFTKICIFVKDLARIFVWQIFMQCITSVLIITSSISYLRYSVLNSYGLLAANLVELFGYCWIGQMILNMTNEVSDSVYSSNWRPCLKDRKISRAFMFFLKHTQVQNKLSAFGLLQLSFITLMRVMKATFSYVAFLQNVTN